MNYDLVDLKQNYHTPGQEAPLKTAKDLICCCCLSFLLWNYRAPSTGGFIKRREAGIFPFYSGMFPLLLLINLYRVYRQILSNHPPTLPWYPDAKKVNETPASTALWTKLQWMQGYENYTFPTDRHYKNDNRPPSQLRWQWPQKEFGMTPFSAQI